MSTTDARTDQPLASEEPPSVNMALEVLVIAVSDPERAKAFYSGIGWRLDADVAAGAVRLVQFTPPGSRCSIQFGAGITASEPGSVRSTYLVVSDIASAREALLARGVAVSPVFHCESGFACRFDGADDRVPGPAPDRGTYGSFASFEDPDGNVWLLQEVTTRLPGRVAGATTFGSADELAAALRRAEGAHGEHEARTGVADANWPDWYATYIVREQAGEELPS